MLRVKCVFMLTALVGLMPPWQAAAQAPTPAVVQGTLVGGNDTSDCWVEFQEVDRSQISRRVRVTPLGSFEVRDLCPGSYRVMVKNASGGLLKQEYVNVYGGSSRITLEVPRLKPKPNVGGTISVARLSHKVPKKAQKEFRRSVKAAHEGDRARSIEHLERAVKLDGEFFVARVNLAAGYLRTGHAPKAIPHLAQAIEIDPSSYEAFQNLGMVLATMGDFDGAEHAARRAVELNPASGKGRYLLGVVLAELGDYKEAMAHLRSALETVPHSQVHIALVLSRSGRVEDAKRELRSYLGLGRPESRQIAEQILAELERRTGSAAEIARAGT